MSMREYPILDKGFIITEENAIDFLKCYKGGNEEIENNEDYLDLIKESIKDNCISDMDLFQELLEDMTFTYLGGISGFFTKLFGNLSQRGNINRTEDIYFEEDSVFILYLDKDLLFDKYNNLEEIYNEIKEFLKEYGFEITDELLKNYIGEVNATIFG